MSDTRDPLEKAVDRTAHEEAIKKAVASERARCIRIALSFERNYGSEVGQMARRIAEVISRYPQ